MAVLGSLVADGLDPQVDPAQVAARVTEWRADFSGIHYTID
jgi:glycine hydroxymethyltransferase